MALFRKHKPLTRYWILSDSTIICEIAHFDWTVERIVQFVQALAVSIGGRCAIYFYPFGCKNVEGVCPVGWHRCTLRTYYRKLRWPNHDLEWVGYESADATGLSQLLTLAWQVSGNEEVLVLAGAGESLKEFEDKFIDDFPNGPNEIAATRTSHYVISRGHDGRSIRLLSAEPDHQRRTTEIINSVLSRFEQCDVADVVVPAKGK